MLYQPHARTHTPRPFPSHNVYCTSRTHLLRTATTDKALSGRQAVRRHCVILTLDPTPPHPAPGYVSTPRGPAYPRTKSRAAQRVVDLPRESFVLVQRHRASAVLTMWPPDSPRRPDISRAPAFLRTQTVTRTHGHTRSKANRRWAGRACTHARIAWARTKKETGATGVTAIQIKACGSVGPTLLVPQQQESPPVSNEVSWLGVKRPAAGAAEAATARR